MNRNGMDEINANIRGCIEMILDQGIRNIIIFPYGDIGSRFKRILNELYGVKEYAIIDNHLCKYNSNIKPIDYLEELRETQIDRFAIVLTSSNEQVYEDLKTQITRYVKNECIFEMPLIKREYVFHKTKIGKHSFGPICRDHLFIDEIGSFCSFAEGVDVVGNHETRYLSTYNFMSSLSTMFDDINLSYEEEYKINGTDTPQHFFSGVNPPIDKITKAKRTRIGNDVWLGRNVIITNGADIGNGVIAGAGAVITKDVPSYAIVGGVPARTIKYRYTQNQIEALNKICWWDWDDEIIRERYYDLFIPIDEFINKYNVANN